MLSCVVVLVWVVVVLCVVVVRFIVTVVFNKTVVCCECCRQLSCLIIGLGYRVSHTTIAALPASYCDDD